MNSCDYDVIVIGAGHAGCEAALVSARLGCSTLLITLNLDMIAHMPCNCSIGGPGKSHLVAEIDALGGEMAHNIDRTMTHVRVLNASRGPAVRALRAQADKALYRSTMKAVLEAQPGLHIHQDMATGLEPLPDGCCAVRTRIGLNFTARRVVITTGTFLNGLIHIGETSFAGGRTGEEASCDLAASLVSLGLRFQRFKTGTVPRVLYSSLDFSRLQVQPSASSPLRFSQRTSGRPALPMLPCYITRTNERTHALLRANFHRSALMSGRISGTGPRYCPSIEAKLVRFPDRLSHTVFLEREGWHTEEVYVQGTSNSMPYDVQLEMLHSMPGMESCVMLRPGYAIEYDALDPRQLDVTLQLRALPGVFTAGQINGTSGYEEAAAQGLVAGANAALSVLGREMRTFPRAQSYIGVMIDDLTRLGADEPYRMLTGRAERRLGMGADTAPTRLSPIVVFPRADSAICRVPVATDDTIDLEISRLETIPAADDPESTLAGALISGSDYASISSTAPSPVPIPERFWDVLTNEARSRPYRSRDAQHARPLAAFASIRVPSDFDYSAAPLRTEAVERFCQVRPANIGAAAQIPGITAADIGTLRMLLLHWQRSGGADTAA